MFEQLPTSLPALTALATIIAAGIAAIVAIVVAVVNAWSARVIAIDTAHREFRVELAASAVQATQILLAQIHKLDQLALQRDVEEWRKAVAGMSPRGLPLKKDLRIPHDPVFAEAVQLFTRRRAQFVMWLMIKGRTEIAPFGLTVARTYIMEAAEIVQVAAEAYVFGVRKPRKRAQRLLKAVDPLPLNKRINEQRAKYDALETNEHELDVEEMGELERS